MLRIADSRLGFFARARPCAFFPCATRCPIIPMTASTVVERKIAGPAHRFLTAARQLRHEGEFAIVLRKDDAGLAERLADHCCELARACAVGSSKIDALRGLSIAASHCGHECVKIGGGVVVVALNGFLSPAQFVPEGVVANKSKFLLTDVALGPRLALLRQKNATDEWREFFVVRWHQLQRRTRVGEPQRAGAA